MFQTAYVVGRDGVLSRMIFIDFAETFCTFDPYRNGSKSAVPPRNETKALIGPFDRKQLE